MSFLQPLLLFALPLAGLPVLIHLINQRRYQSLEWGAMQFLLTANRMNRGFARIRRWLIMAVRVLAVAALVLGISRPLASGWLAVAAAGEADTTIVVLDRSPSMQHRFGGVSLLEAARRQLAGTLEVVGSKRWVLIDSATAEPREVESCSALLDSPRLSGLSAEADLPALLQATHDYIKANTPGRTEVWIASDLRENDWKAEDGRWASLRRAFSRFDQEVRIHLLEMTGETGGPENLSVRVERARLDKSSGTPELVLSVGVSRHPRADTEPPTRTLPLRFDVGGARTVEEVELAGAELKLTDFRIPLGLEVSRGWGRVTLPVDANPADDAAYFVFGEAPIQRTLIVSDDTEVVRPLRLAASISPTPGEACQAFVLPPGGLQAVPWEGLALVLWHAALPTGDTARQLEQFLARGGQVVLFPPRAPSAEAWAGVSWGVWRQPPSPVTPATWRGDQDLLRRSESGLALPVGGWRVRRYCTLEGEGLTALASLPGGQPLVARATTDTGGLYFCTTTPKPSDSSMAADGVVLYVGLRRALEQGLQSLAETRTLVAGRTTLPEADSPWRRLGGDEAAADGAPLSAEYSYCQGVYSSGEQLVAVGRPADEDHADRVESARVDQLFEGLAFDRVAQAGVGGSPLVQEVWRLLLGAMMIALMAEAALCLPRRRSAGPLAGMPVQRRPATSPAPAQEVVA